MKNEKRTIYVHKYAVSTGKIQKCEAELLDNGAAWADWPGNTYPFYLSKKDFAFNYQDSHAAALNLALKAKLSAAKRVDKLERLIKSGFALKDNAK